MAALEGAPANPPAERHSHSQYLIVTLLVALWQGMIGVLVKWSNWPPVTMVWGRCVVTIIALALFERLTKGQHSRVGPGNTRQRVATWISGALLAGHWITLFWGYRVCDAGPVVVALFTFPVMAALVEPWFFEKRPRAVELLTACIATAGVACMKLWNAGDAAASTNTTLGIGLGLCSAAFFTARGIASRKLLRHASASRIMQEQALVVAVLLLPSTLLLTPSHLAWREVALILVLGVGFTALSHTLSVWAMRRLTVAASGIIGSLQTISTLVLVQALIGEAVTLGVWVGAGTVMLAVALESVMQTRARHAS